jgi:hypothetical protein
MKPPRPHSRLPTADLATATRTSSLSVGTRRYSNFIDELRRALAEGDAATFNPLLDGRAAAQCFALVPETSVRRLGAFFTPSKVARKIVGQLSVDEWTQAVFFDPACGAADLLLPIAAKLPVQPTASATLRLWNERLLGCDISAEFISAARLRLVLLAVKRGAQLDDTADSLANLLTNLFVGDGLSLTAEYQRSSHIVMNPPFGRISTGAHPWREGTITAAALFVERAVRLSTPGSEIVALLPEVLRTGTSYANWRNHVGALASRFRPQSIGLFSEEADVDVFIQRFARLPDGSTAAPRRRSKPVKQTVGDKFVVSVGAVVPHRDKASGPEFAYLHAGNTEAWSEIRRVSERRQFARRTFMPPFVVVRRTSRPGDHHRAVATLVLGSRQVAVENHLLVLSPKRGGAALCRALVKLLRSHETTEFLNGTIRCRHLTTASVSSLPWL